jgi:hypothetical protein
MKLIWLCPAAKKAIGGIKVIYKQSELANSILQPLGHKSIILHPNRISFKVNWFEHNAIVENKFFKWHWIGKSSLSKIDGCFNSKDHILIIPETWAAKFGTQLARLKIPYIIYVQNGYLINKGSSSDLIEAYENAKCIMTISEDTSRCVAMAFPRAADKIFRVHYSINSDLFNPNNQKENIITYMPRKMSTHSSKVIFFLLNHLPNNWKIQAIENLNEEGVANLLKKSKIFMSFSDFEGCPLPPLEAALSGNHVIGYTGQGAKEYWIPEIFDTVESGDVVGFARMVRRKITDLETSSNPINQEKIRNLASIYSGKKEYADITNLLKKIGLH